MNSPRRAERAGAGDRAGLAARQGSDADPAAGAILTVDLDAVRENFRRLKARAGSAECAAVVKADAYGLGAGRVGSALMREGCGSFFVAHVGEGAELRKALGGGARIFVLNGAPPGAEGACLAAALTPVVNSLEQFAAWRQAARAAGRRLGAAVQVDSGMSRLGLAPSDVVSLSADRSVFEGVEVVLAMSHLACADEPEHAANPAQREAFEALRGLLPPVPASLANSSGIFLDASYRLDMVRPGAALYGVNPTPGRENPMRPVVRLEARVIQTRTIPAAAGVGYGHDFHAPGEMRVATIAVGYADGWPRRAASRAWFDGKNLPFVGRVSMDSIVLDASALPPGAPREGDFIELIGDRQTVDDVARDAGTIGYEILTGLGRRLHRRYTGG